MAEFDPKKDIPDLNGKVILVTGGTAGVGAEALIELARHNPSHLLFTGRNSKSGQEIVTKIQAISSTIKVTFIRCDLADLSSVKSASENLLSQLDRLDVLVCNAGIMAVPAALSKDGYEIHFATNHLGHALLTKKLLPLLERTADSGHDVRIIILSSVAWKANPPGGIEFDRLKTTQDIVIGGRWLRYGQSKLANMLYARELAQRHPKILSVSVHPGVVKTALVNDLSLADKALVLLPNIGRMKTPEEGAYNTLWTITAPREKVQPGKFYEPVGKASTLETKASKDPELAGKLWEWTEQELEKWM